MAFKRVVKKECLVYARKKMAMGCLLFLVGFLWYANETNLLGITVDYFWQDMLMLIGVLFFLKGLLIKLKK